MKAPINKKDPFDDVYFVFEIKGRLNEKKEVLHTFAWVTPYIVANVTSVL